MRIPRDLVAGDTITWKDYATYGNLRNVISAPDWTLKYALRGATTLDLTSSISSDGWTTTITPVQSAALTPGVYFWQAYAEKADERVTLGHGSIKVYPNVATAGANFDGRSQARKDLEAVQVAMRTLISGGAVQRYAIGSRQVDKMPLADLIALESKLKLEVAREEKANKIANGLGNPDNLYVRFRR